MDEQPKKRRFWQLHLSTAVLLMVVAAGMVGFDVRVIEGALCGTGWSMLAVFTPIQVVLLLMLRSICESLIRRREARKP